MSMTEMSLLGIEPRSPRPLTKVVSDHIGASVEKGVKRSNSHLIIMSVRLIIWLNKK